MKKKRPAFRVSFSSNRSNEKEEKQRRFGNPFERDKLFIVCVVIITTFPDRCKYLAKEAASCTRNDRLVTRVSMYRHYSRLINSCQQQILEFEQNFSSQQETALCRNGIGLKLSEKPACGQTLRTGSVRGQSARQGFRRPEKRLRACGPLTTPQKGS